jgi:hypothetical protein
MAAARAVDVHRRGSEAERREVRQKTLRKQYAAGKLDVVTAS